MDIDVPVQMRDGVTLRADVWRPDSPGPHPVVLVRLPYDKSITGLQLLTEPVPAAQRGFITVVQDTRGRFRSEGENWRPWEKEAEDGYDTIEWASKLEGSNGKVVMLGQSYFGNTQWSAASQHHPALSAIVPGFTWFDPHDGLLSRGGAREIGVGVPWALGQGIDVLTRRHATDPAAMGAAIGALIADLEALPTTGYAELPSGRHPVIARHNVPELGYELCLDHPNLVEELVPHPADAGVPSMNVGGWWDVFLQGTIDNFVEASSTQPSMLVIGPWGHGQPIFTGLAGETNFGLFGGAATANHGGSLRDLQFDWFDRWARDDVDATAADAKLGAPVRIFVMGTGQWRDEQEWPLARAVDTPLYLSAPDELVTVDAAAGTREFEFDPLNPVPTRGGNLFISPEYPLGQYDQSAIELRDDVVTFTSEPLNEALEVTGRVQATLFASTDGPSTDWVVRVCDLDQNGVSRNVVDGIRRTHAPAGEIAEHEIDLWSTSYVFAAGHRIRVQVTSSNFPRWDRNPNTGESTETATVLRTAHQTVHLGAETPSRIVLPVIPVG